MFDDASRWYTSSDIGYRGGFWRGLVAAMVWRRDGRYCIVGAPDFRCRYEGVYNRRAEGKLLPGRFFADGDGNDCAYAPRLSLRLSIPTKPIRPVPSNANEDGSGTAGVIVPPRES